MKKFVFYISLILIFVGCSGEIDTSAKEVNWDRAQCERCAMMLGDKDFAAQVVSLEDGKEYNFDDIGCAVKWLNNAGNLHKLDNVNLFVRNSENDKFIDAKEAKYTTDRISPMSFNFLAHPVKTELNDYLTFQEIVLQINGTSNHKNHKH